MRNLKVLGLAALAVFAMAAMAAPAAQAAATLTAGKTLPTIEHTKAAIHAKQYGSAVEITTNSFTSDLGKFNCDDKETNFTIHPIVAPGSKDGTYSELTVTPEYKHCTTITKTDTKGTPVTVTTNGCDFLFRNLETVTPPTNPPTYKSTVDVICPAGKVIEVHVYGAGTVTNHSIPLCTLTVGEQKGLEGVTLKNISEAGKKDDVTVAITTEGIAYSYHGLCGSGSAKNGVYHSELTLTSTEHDLWLSD